MDINIGFVDKMYDETFYAEAIAKHLNTDHMTLYADPSDALDLIQKMPQVYAVEKERALKQLW